jgi:isoquinoline 1-oxidoreductase alpha subunit
VQQAWIAEQVTMCGYCEPGFIMAIAAMLEANPAPGDDQVAALPNICRCGAYPRIKRAIARAARAKAARPAGEQTEPKRLSGGSSDEAQILPQ